jgi:hypothetical protein
MNIHGNARIGFEFTPAVVMREPHAVAIKHGHQRAARRIEKL